jgi:hypothetical protein
MPDLQSIYNAFLALYFEHLAWLQHKILFQIHEPLTVVGTLLIVFATIYSLWNNPNFPGFDVDVLGRAFLRYGIILAGAFLLTAGLVLQRTNYPTVPMVPVVHKFQCPDMKERCVEPSSFVGNIRTILGTERVRTHNQAETLRSAGVLAFPLIEEAQRKEDSALESAKDALASFYKIVDRQLGRVNRLVHSAAQRDEERRWAKDIPRAAVIKVLGNMPLNASHTLCELSWEILTTYDNKDPEKSVVAVYEIVLRALRKVELRANTTAGVASQAWYKTDKLSWRCLFTGMNPSCATMIGFNYAQQKAAKAFFRQQRKKSVIAEMLYKSWAVYGAAIEDAQKIIDHFCDEVCAVEKEEAMDFAYGYQGQARERWSIPENLHKEEDTIQEDYAGSDCVSRRGVSSYGVESNAG